MHLKRYRRPTVKEALRAAREDLGADALVLSTRMVPAAGVRGWLGAREVEITAATERPLVSEDRQRPAKRPSERAVNEIAARLEASGMDAALAREIAAAHPAMRRRGATAETLAVTLAEQLASMSADADEATAPIEVFVGPPGVGKTTTIAKIAAQERARHGKRLGLLAADGFRVGAVEQLRLFADIIGAPFTIARSPRELEEALKDARRPLLLDTAGRSPSDQVSRDMFRIFAGRSDVRTHLVLSANTPAASARRAVERFEEAAPSRLVITKLDEAETFAPLVGVLRERKLPISYLGTGQSVPDDLQRATPAMLAAWVMGDVAGQGAVA